jgi:DUF1365 family protein
MNIGQGNVFHSRKEGVSHSFRYPTFFLYFKCAKEQELKDTLCKKFAGFVAIASEDYLKGKPGPIDQNIKSFLKEFCGFDAQDVWLHTLPRMFGYAFNPVSFWFCKRGEKLEAVLVEVNNTFGERHFYWLHPENGIKDQWIRAEKVMHVSPFFPVEGFYNFRFQLTEKDARIDINYHSPDGSLRLATWVSGALSPLASQSLLSVCVKYGWITPMVVFRIHIQAIRLWFQKIRFYRKPAPPQQEVT